MSIILGPSFPEMAKWTFIHGSINLNATESVTLSIQMFKVNAILNAFEK